MSFFESIKEALPNPVEFWEKVAGAMPNVIAAIALIIAGHFIGKFLSLLIVRLLQRIGLDKLGEKAGLDDMAKQGGFTLTPATLFGQILYWLIFLTFLISAADALGLARVSETISDFVNYLPKVVGALLVLIVGMFTARAVRSLTEAALGGINLGYETAIGGLVYGIVLIVVLSLAIGQLEVETELLNQVISILLMAGAAAVALALGLGTREVAGNIVAGVYARDLYMPGSTIRVGDVEGTIIEVGSTSIVIDTGDGKTVTVPNKLLLEEKVETSE